MKRGYAAQFGERLKWMIERVTTMDVLKRKIIDFSHFFYKGTVVKPFDGNYSSTPDSSDPDLFGAIDFVYSFYICGLLEEVTSNKSRKVWADRIMTYQGEGGWFKSSDSQNHSVYHSTAYALGALKILGFIDGVVHKWFRRGMDYPLSDETPVILEVLFNGFVGEKTTSRLFFEPGEDE